MVAAAERRAEHRERIALHQQRQLALELERDERRLEVVRAERRERRRGGVRVLGMVWRIGTWRHLRRRAALRVAPERIRAHAARTVSQRRPGGWPKHRT